MSVAAAEDPRERAAARSTLATCGGAHAVHDGFGDCVYLFLPLWQAERPDGRRGCDEPDEAGSGC